MTLTIGTVGLVMKRIMNYRIAENIGEFGELMANRQSFLHQIILIAEFAKLFSAIRYCQRRLY